MVDIVKTAKVEVMTESDRWILKIVGSLIVAGIIGGGATLTVMRTDIAVLKTELVGVNTRLEQSMAKRYDIDMANADKQLMIQMIDMLRRDVDRNNNKIQSLENKMSK